RIAPQGQGNAHPGSAAWARHGSAKRCTAEAADRPLYVLLSLPASRCKGFWLHMASRRGTIAPRPIAPCLALRPTAPGPGDDACSRGLERLEDDNRRG